MRRQFPLELLGLPQRLVLLLLTLLDRLWLVSAALREGLGLPVVELFQLHGLRDADLVDPPVPRQGLKLLDLDPLPVSVLVHHEEGLLHHLLGPLATMLLVRILGAHLSPNVQDRSAVVRVHLLPVHFALRDGDGVEGTHNRRQKGHQHQHQCRSGKP